MTITAQGYGVEATLTPQTLTIRATSKAGRMSVFGPDPRDEVTIPLGDVTSARHIAPPKILLGAMNGVLVVRTADGKRYQLNYRARKNREFRPLAEAVVAAVED